VKASLCEGQPAPDTQPRQPPERSPGPSATWHHADVTSTPPLPSLPPEPQRSGEVGRTHVLLLKPQHIDTVVTDAIGDLIRGAVSQGEALGWIDPPDANETRALVDSIAFSLATADAAIALARSTLTTGDPTSRLEGSDERENATGAGSQPINADVGMVTGLGYWRRYTRPTNRVHADIPLLLVDMSARGQGIGGWLLDSLMTAARAAGIEQLTLDARGDNHAAHSLWRSRGFTQYGVLTDFVAVGDARFDKTFWVTDLRDERSRRA